MPLSLAGDWHTQLCDIHPPQFQPERPQTGLGEQQHCFNQENESEG